MRSLRPFTMAASSLNDDLVHLCNIGDDLPLSTLFANIPGAEERWHTHAWPRICDAIGAAVLSVADAAMIHTVRPPGRVHKGPSSFELFGFDFVMTADLDPWLLEANTSPDMGERSGPEMQPLVAQAVSGILDIVLGLHEKTLTVPAVGEFVSAWQCVLDHQIDPDEARRRFYAKGPGPPSCAYHHNHIDVVRQAFFPTSNQMRNKAQTGRSHSSPPSRSGGNQDLEKQEDRDAKSHLCRSTSFRGHSRALARKLEKQENRADSSHPLQGRQSLTPVAGVRMR